jgi:hypothetical protein
MYIQLLVLLFLFIVSYSINLKTSIQKVSTVFLDESAKKLCWTQEKQDSSCRVRIWKRDGHLLLSNGEQSIRISSIKGKILQVTAGRVDEVPTNSKSLECVGIFGVYHLPGGTYLLLIKSSKKITEIARSPIHVATEFEFLKIPSIEVEKISPFLKVKMLQKQITAERFLLHAIQRHQFYFSLGKYDFLKTFANTTRLLPAAYNFLTKFTLLCFTPIE